MTKKLKPGEERRQVLEGWIERYGDQVYRTSLAFFGDVSCAQDAYVHSFVTAYRLYDELSMISDESNVILAATLSACMTLPSDTVHVAEVSKPAGDSDARGTENAAVEDSDAESSVLGGGESWVAQVSELPKPVRAALLGAVWVETDWTVLSTVLLLPQRLIRHRLQHALTSLTHEFKEDITVEAVRIGLEKWVGSISVPDWLRMRAGRQVKATQAQFDAECRHRGPRLWVYATLATTILGFAAIAFGMQRAHAVPTVSTASGASADAADGLPLPLQNLPGVVAGQYEIPTDFSTQALSHLAIGPDAIYFPTLKQSADSWPTIEISACKFSDTGQPLAKAEKSVASVSAIPPTVSAADNSDSKGKARNWTIQDWQVQVGNPWAEVLVHWGDPADKTISVVQVYALYLPSGQSSLVKTIGPGKQSGSNVVAAGDNRIVVQESVPQKSTSASAALIGLPLDVYTLQGTQPLRALNGPTEIAAPFGLMVHPAMTGDILTFQGIAGQPDDATSSNATWYTLSWDGQLSRYAGAPLDGRPHWAVRGTSGKLWWCETTPDPTNANHLQVLMAPMEDESAEQQVPAETLSGSVSFFTVSGQSMAWVQNTKGVNQLVVEAVQ